MLILSDLMSSVIFHELLRRLHWVRSAQEVILLGCGATHMMDDISISFSRRIPDMRDNLCQYLDILAVLI